MAEYPTSPVPQYPCEITQNWKTITSAFDSGAEQRRQKQVYPKYDVSLNYNALESADLQTLWNFYRSMSGALTAFYFYTIEAGEWDGLFVGTGNGTAVTFDLPGKETSAQVIYINGVAVDPDDYTLVAGGGTENADRVTFDTAPTVNAIITCDFTGKMRIRCRFKEDKMSKVRFEAAIYKTGLELKGLAAL